MSAGQDPADTALVTLAPGGVAYVSYNTYPGWHLSTVIRDLMLYHSGALPRSKDRLRQARLVVWIS